MPYNVKSCKKFDEKAQTAKFTVLQREISSAVLKTWKTRKTKTWITQFFQIIYPIQGTTMWTLTSWGFRKCGTFWVYDFLKGSYWLSIRARWFQLFVVDSFGELSDCTGYRKNHFGLNGFGVGGLLYPPRTLPMWQNFIQRVEKQVVRFFAAYIWSDACHIHPNFLSYQEKHFGEDRSGRG